MCAVSIVGIDLCLKAIKETDDRNNTHTHTHDQSKKQLISNNLCNQETVGHMYRSLLITEANAKHAQANLHSLKCFKLKQQQKN